MFRFSTPLVTCQLPLLLRFYVLGIKFGEINVESRENRWVISGERKAEEDKRRDTTLCCARRGGSDEPVIEMNLRAHDLLRWDKQLEIIAGATHLFFTLAALQEMARFANDWFQRHLVGVQSEG